MKNSSILRPTEFTQKFTIKPFQMSFAINTVTPEFLIRNESHILNTLAFFAKSCGRNCLPNQVLAKSYTYL